MKLSARGRVVNKHEEYGAAPSRRLSFFGFLKRYPIFFFAFGPPIFRLPNDNVDATKGILDIWSFIQVGLLAMITSRAIWRLGSTRSIFIPKQVRTILILTLILNVIFLASATYSPSRIVSAAYAILYFMTLICVYEFILDVYRNPPNMLQCMFHLRMIALLLMILVIAVSIIKPNYIITRTEEGFHFSGGAVGAAGPMCTMIAIISAYAFLYSLESRARSTLFFLFGLAGTMSTRSRGAEISLLFSLMFLAYLWAKIGRYTKYMFISGFSFFILLSGMIIGSVGGGRIWNIFNRGQNIRGIESASGRTDIWYFVIQYCTAHPLGMGYIAGFRMLFRNYFTLDLQVNVFGIGNAHNTYLQVLSDAGWLALAIYLIMLMKVVRIALRFANKRFYSNLALDNDFHYTIECSLVMLVSCLSAGISAADYVVPLRSVFYWQFILIGIILGASATMLDAFRARRSVLVRR